MPKLVAISGPLAGREFELGEVCVVGRDAASELCVDDLTVSRRHARLVMTAEGHVVEDLRSGNGTFVNDNRVQRHKLEHAEQIRLGESVFRFIADVPWDDPVLKVATVLSEQSQYLVETVTEVLEPGEGRDLSDFGPDDYQDRLARAKRMLETLYAVADTTSSVLEPETLFTRILDYLFDVFPAAHRGFVMLLDEGGQLVPGAVRRRRGIGTTDGLTVAQPVLSRVLREQKPVLSNPAPNANGPLSSPCLAAPMVAQGTVHGVLQLEAHEDASPFSRDDLNLLAGVAMLTAVAYHNASLHQRLMRQQRLEQDLRFARQVQRSFLPPNAPQAKGYRFTRNYNPVFQVGGDFYDFVPLPEGRLGVVIGDVSGKGVSAALLMARLSCDIRYYAMAETRPGRVMARTNEAIINRMQSNMFVTMLYLLFDPGANTMQICNAGHIPPLIRHAERQGDDRVELVEEATNLAVGVLPNPTFDEVTVDLRPGDTVLLCTDGVVEAKNIKGEEFGFERLNRAMAEASSGMVAESVLRDVRRFTRSTPQYDDITVVSISRLPQTGRLITQEMAIQNLDLDAIDPGEFDTLKIEKEGG